MNWLIVVGVLITLCGLGLLTWCIGRVWVGRRTAQDGDAVKALIQSVLPWNLAAMGISGIGLMCVILGLVL